MSTRLLSSALLLTSALVSPAALAEPKYPATVDVFGGVNGDGPGGGLELIAPFAEGEGSLLFGLARGSLWDETGGGGIGLGYRTISMAPVSIGPIKSMVMSLDVSLLEPWLFRLLEAGESNLRGQLKRFAEEHAVEI